MRLGKEDILKADDLPSEVVRVPEWGGDVLVRGMSGQERDDFEARSLRRRGNEMETNADNIRARMVARCVIDEDTGEPMFTEADAAALGKKSARAITRIADVAARLSGIGEQDIEELAENFGQPGEPANGDGDGSSSSSPATSARPPKGSSAR